MMASHPDWFDTACRLLGRHPAVAQVVPSASDVAVAVIPRPDGGRHRHTATYRRIFDAEVANGLDSAVWRSSYDDAPLRPEEMEEWVSATIDRIRWAEPSAVLEIGCGTGLLLSPLAPSTRRYVGTDISGATIEQLRRQLRDGADGVELEVGPADELSVIVGPFDAIVVNSVVQYFPTLAYLKRVLRQAAALTADEATMFVGDVRNASLLEALHVDVELARAKPSDRLDVVRTKARRRQLHDQELTIDPLVLIALVEDLRGPAHVEAWPRRGSHRNEMTCFRYDVSVRWGQAVTDALEPDRWLRWGHDLIDREELRQVLCDDPGTTGVVGVPNARVPLLSVDRLPADMTVEVLLAETNRWSSDAVDPEWLWRSLRAHGVEGRLSWAHGRRDGSFDVVSLPYGSRHRPVRFASLDADVGAVGARPSRPYDALVTELEMYVADRMGSLHELRIDVAAASNEPIGSAS